MGRGQGEIIGVFTRAKIYAHSCPNAARRNSVKRKRQSTTSMELIKAANSYGAVNVAITRLKTEKYIPFI